MRQHLIQLLGVGVMLLSIGSAHADVGDQHFRLDIVATNFVNDSGGGGAGEIELSIKHLVFVPFLAFTFESFIDQVEIVVE